MRIAVVRSPGWVLVALAAFVVGSALCFVSEWFPMAGLIRLERASGGWLSVTLLASGTVGLIELALVLGPGRQDLSDIGWQRGKLVPALLATLALWGVMQLSTLLGSLANGVPLQMAKPWQLGWGIALGPLLGQVLGTALMEESIFRGYLWPQLTARCERWFSQRASLWLGLLASQAFFGLVHIPIRVHGGASPGEVAVMVATLFVFGLIFAAVFAATRNLFLAVGIHALGNAPSLLFVAQGPAPTLVLLSASLVLSLVWRRIGRRGVSSSIKERFKDVQMVDA